MLKASYFLGFTCGRHFTCLTLAEVYKEINCCKIQLPERVKQYNQAI